MNLKGATAALTAFNHAMGKNTVSKEMVMERYSACAKCPQRRQVSGFQSKISQYLGRVANHHKVPKDVSNFKCNVCQCSLILLLPAIEEDLHEDSPAQAKKRPAACWINKPPSE